MADPRWEQILADMERDKLPYQRRARIARNYFQKEIASDPNFIAAKERNPELGRKVATNFWNTLQPQQKGVPSPTMEVVKDAASAGADAVKGLFNIGGQAAMDFFGAGHAGIVGTADLARRLVGGQNLDEAMNESTAVIKELQNAIPQIVNDQERGVYEKVMLPFEAFPMVGRGLASLEELALTGDWNKASAVAEGKEEGLGSHWTVPAMRVLGEAMAMGVAPRVTRPLNTRIATVADIRAGDPLGYGRVTREAMGTDLGMGHAVDPRVYTDYSKSFGEAAARKAQADEANLENAKNLTGYEIDTEAVSPQAVEDYSIKSQVAAADTARSQIENEARSLVNPEEYGLSKDVEMSGRTTEDMQAEARAELERARGTRDASIEEAGYDLNSEAGLSPSEISSRSAAKVEQQMQSKKEGLLGTLDTTKREVGARELFTDEELGRFGVSAEQKGLTVAELRFKVHQEMLAALSKNDLMEYTKKKIIGEMIDRKLLTYDPVAPEFSGEAQPMGLKAEGEGFTAKEPYILRKDPDVTGAILPENLEVIKLTKTKSGEPFKSPQAAQLGLKRLAEKNGRPESDYEVRPHRDGYAIFEKEQRASDAEVSVKRGETRELPDKPAEIARTEPTTEKPTGKEAKPDAKKQIEDEKKAAQEAPRAEEEPKPPEAAESPTQNISKWSEIDGAIEKAPDLTSGLVKAKDKYGNVEYYTSKYDASRGFHGKTMRELIADAKKEGIEVPDVVIKTSTGTTYTILGEKSVLKNFKKAAEKEFSGKKDRAQNFTLSMNPFFDPRQIAENFTGLARNIGWAAKQIGIFFDPASFVKGLPEVMKDRQRLLGTFNDAHRAMKQVAKNFSGLSKEDGRILYDYIQGISEKKELPKHLKKYAEHVDDVSKKIDEVIKAFDLLPPDEIRKEGGLKWMYNRHLEAETFGKHGYGGFGLKMDWKEPRHDWGVRYVLGELDKNFPQLSKQDRGLLKKSFGTDAIFKRDELPEALRPAWDIVDKQIAARAGYERDAFGAIHSVPVSLTRMIGDVMKEAATREYFSKIAGNPDIVPVFDPNKVLSLRGEKWTVNKAIKELNLLEQRKKAKLLDNPEQIELYKTLKEQLNDIGFQKGIDLRDFRYVEGKKWGDLSGKYVHKTVVQDIEPILELFDPKSRGMEMLINATYAANYAWKMSKTAASFPTWGHNMVSGALQQLMGGQSPLSLIKAFYRVPKALYDHFFGKGSDVIQKYLKEGGSAVNFNQAELLEAANYFERYARQGMEKYLFEAMDKTRKFLGLYGRIDDFWRLNAFMEKLEGGATPRDAMWYANRWNMDYSFAHPAIKWLRNMPIGGSFITYQYKILPLYFEAWKNNPITMAAMHLLAVYMSHSGMSNFTTKDALSYLAKLPSKMKNGMTPIIPINGRPNYIDVTSWLPWGNWLQIATALRHGDISEAVKQLGLGGSLGNLFITALTGEDPWTGRKIVSPLVKEGGTPIDKVLEVSKFLWNYSMPSTVNTNNIDRIKQFHTKGVFPFKEKGQPVPMEWYHVYPRLGGLNINPIRPEAAALEERGRINELKRNAKTELRRITTNDADDKERKKEIEQRLKRGIKNVTEEYKPPQKTLLDQYLDQITGAER